MEKLEKYLDKEKLANAGGDCEIIDILESVRKKQVLNCDNIENYNEIIDLLRLLYMTNTLMVMAQEEKVASNYYNEIYELYHKIKIDTAKAVGYEDLWNYGN